MLTDGKRSFREKHLLVLLLALRLASATDNSNPSITVQPERENAEEKIIDTESIIVKKLISESKVGETSSDSQEKVHFPDNVQGPSLPGTTKPPCPSYITCPYPPYPRPTTKPPGGEKVEASTNSSPNKEEEQLGPATETIVNRVEQASEPSSETSKPDKVNLPGNAQGPSVPATPKPPCPSYISCPYPSYPRPTTKKPTEGGQVEASTNSPPMQVEEQPGPATETIVNRVQPTDESSSDSTKPDKVNLPGNAQGPSVPATPKPPCPSYITCPYPPYPRPTTKPPGGEKVEASTNSSPNKEGEQPGPATESIVNRVEQGSESSYETSKPEKVNQPGNAQGPSVSATPKPPCPSYITCPYPPYPRPTTKPPEGANVETSTNSPPEKVGEQPGPTTETIVNRVQEGSESSSETSKPENVNQPGNAQGPSIPATPKPPCPSYISCPYPSYPRPTTKKPTEGGQVEASTNSPPNKEEEQSGSATETIVNRVQPTDESSSDSTKPDKVNLPGNAEGPSVPATPKPPCPSYISCPYPSYPRPTTKKPTEGQVEASTNSPPNKEEEQSGPATESIVNRVQPSSEPISETSKPEKVNQPGNAQGPSVSATPKPLCPSYITCPYPPYPRPTTMSPKGANVEVSPNPIPEKASENFSDNGENVNGPMRRKGTSSVSEEYIEAGTTAYSPGADSSYPPSRILPSKNGEALTHVMENSGDWIFPGPANGRKPSHSLADRIDDSSEKKDHAIRDTLRISSGPSVPLSRKPLCSFYASCPYEYPKPTTSAPITINRIFGGGFYANNQKSPLNSGTLESNKHVPTGVGKPVANGGLAPNRNPLLHTNSPQIVPTVNGGGTSQQLSPHDMTLLGNQGAFLPFYTYVYGIDPYLQRLYYYNGKPYILSPPRPSWPQWVNPISLDPESILFDQGPLNDASNEYEEIEERTK